MKPDGYLPDGTVLFIAARGSAKSNITLEIYRKLVGISDDEWEEMKREARTNLGYDE